MNHLDWDGFSTLLARTPAGNGGGMLAPWFVPEITPLVPQAGPRWKDVDPSDAPRAVRVEVPETLNLSELYAIRESLKKYIAALNEASRFCHQCSYFDLRRLSTLTGRSVELSEVATV